MTTLPARETRRDRALMARSAGFGKLSLLSVLAGVLVAYGAFTVLLALAAGIAAAIGNHTNLTVNDWRRLTVGSAIVVAIVLFLAYLFGGYVSGRMARRSGWLNGLAVFILAVLIVVAISAILASQVDRAAILANLRTLGVPTSRHEWTKVGTIAGIASLAAMLLGSLLGGILGDRWHTKLSDRALSPEFGPDRDLSPPVGEPVADTRVTRRTVVAERPVTEHQVVDRPVLRREPVSPPPAGPETTEPGAVSLNDPDTPAP